MNLENSMEELNITEVESNVVNYNYINVFKNPNNLPINQIHLERSWFELRKVLPRDMAHSEFPTQELDKFYETKKEIIPALDRRWLPKCVLFKFESYLFDLCKEENSSFIPNNIKFMESLEYLLKCNFHQFWCTILFEPSAVISLRSFILNPILSYQMVYLEGEESKIYNSIFNMFFLVYERLIAFRVSETEYIPKDYAYSVLLQKKLINLPIVITLASLYKHSNLEFVNNLTSLYFDDTSQLDFQTKELEEMINQTLIILEMIGGHVCGFDKDAVIVPIAVTPRPPVFSLSWIYSVENYFLNTILLLNTLLEFYRPAVEMCLNKQLPFRIPFTYVSVYRELYEMLDNREELDLQKDLSDKVFDEINLGRTECIDLYHIFISYCLDKTLECTGDAKQQEYMVEVYLRLLTTALEDDYFICDYNMKYNVASQNEMFESCSPLDSTRTEFIVSCINKFPRHKRLQQLSKLKRKTIEDVFKQFKPPEIEPIEQYEPSTGPSNESDIPGEKDVEMMVKDIMDMFPHLGDGFILKCLESYNYNASDVINSILEENLPPHLYEIPFDSIRIPPEPEPEKPVLAYRGKKPDYDDALTLINDKKDIKALKTFILEGIQHSNDYRYDDEYDDSFDDGVPIKVADNPLEEDVLTLNPNHEELVSDTSYSSDGEYDDYGKPVSKTSINNGNAGSSQVNRTKMNFCEDPALIRERREAQFRSKHRTTQNPQKQSNVIGQLKGQGQDKNVLKAREKKTVNKSSKANHSRKGGAQWKRSRGMVPS